MNGRRARRIRKEHDVKHVRFAPVGKAIITTRSPTDTSIDHRRKLSEQNLHRVVHPIIAGSYGLYNKIGRRKKVGGYS